jgi:plastocyanin
MKIKLFVIGLALAISLVGCSSGPAPLEITMSAADISLDVTRIEAKVGQMVNITMSNKGVLEHNFNIDELGVKQASVKAGETVKFSFSATKPGTYNYYCGIAGHELLARGDLVVTE